MTPIKPKPQATPPAQPSPSAADDADFAEEAGPKQTEFDSEKDAKNLTAGGFDPIP
jgi:hypothetical protein